MEDLTLLKIKKIGVGELAVNRYGRLLQTVVAMEEMAGLTKELSKAVRKNFDLGNDSIAEEIADVEIMLEQLKQIFRCGDAVNLWTESKLQRLYERIKSELEGEDGQRRDNCCVAKEP